MCVCVLHMKKGRKGSKNVARERMCLIVVNIIIFDFKSCLLCMKILVEGVSKIFYDMWNPLHTLVCWLCVSSIVKNNKQFIWLWLHVALLTKYIRSLKLSFTWAILILMVIRMNRNKKYDIRKNIIQFPSEKRHNIQE